jgi:hypothetical protein
LVTDDHGIGGGQWEDDEGATSDARHRISIYALIVGFLIANAVLLSAYAFSGAALFSALNNALSIGILALCVLLALGPGNVLNRHPILVSLLAFAIIGTLVVNLGRTNFVDVVKYLGVFAFYFVGRYVMGPARFSRPIVLALALIPLAGLALDNRIYSQNVAFSYFPNANTAAIYFTALVFCSFPMLGGRAYVLQILQVLFFQKIGILLATFVSMFAWNVAGMRLRALLIGLTVAIFGALAYWLGLLDRITLAVSGLYRDIFEIGLDTIVSMPYSDIIERQGSTDLSGYFRIKHWIEIWLNYIGGGPVVQLFGYGPGRTPSITYAELIPHNDYLRIIAEFGIINFACFIYLNLFALFSLKDKGLRIFFSILLIYYSSENLIDNFASMAIFYVAAGLYAQAGREPRPAPAPDAPEDLFRA